jgi:hypothetical protein
MCPSCSQNAHDRNVLAWDKSASRRARGWAGEDVARSKGQPGYALPWRVGEKDARNGGNRQPPPFGKYKQAWKDHREPGAIFARQVPTIRLWSLDSRD